MEQTISKSPKCKRIINSILLIFLISDLFSNSQMYKTMISDFLNNCHKKIKYILQQKETICASAFTQYLSKLNEIINKVLNKSIISVHEKVNRWNNQQIFAIDESRIIGYQGKTELLSKLSNFIGITINSILSQNETIKTN